MEKTAKSKPSKPEACDLPAASVEIVTLEATESDSVAMPAPDGPMTDVATPSGTMTDAPTPSATPCGVRRGSLPGKCASMVFPYVPVQDNNPVRYSRMEALETGTLSPD